MKNRTIYIQIFGLSIFALFLIIIVPIYERKISKALTKEVKERLYQKNMRWLTVDTIGRDVELSGTAPNIEAHNRAIDTAKTVTGVGEVIDKISPTIITPYNMEIGRNGNRITLKGYMPSDTSKRELLKKLENSYKRENISETINIGKGEPKGWNEAVLSISLLLQKLKLGIVEIENNQINISGKSETIEDKNYITRSLESIQKKGYTINSHIISMDEPYIICQKRFNSLLSNRQIRFRLGKTELESDSLSLLRELADITSLCPKAKIEIIGHTDNIGNSVKNRDLSKERAKTVIARLFQMGVPLERMRAVGKGEEEPIANNNTKEGRAKNRRIEFKVEGY